MATNNLLVNNEKKVLYDIQKRVERSGHNLSQSRKFPCDVGFIYPFFCRKTLPSDSFKISTNILIKQLQPLLVPQMVSFTVNTAFYWVDYSLAFPEFEYFLINQRGTHNIELPFISMATSDLTTPNLQSVVSFGSDIRTFLDITKNATTEKIDALPFWTYQTIIRDFYLNIDRLSESEYQNWFPTDPSDWKLKPGMNYRIGVQTTSTGINPFVIRTHNVRGDYFINSYPTPLRGDIPNLNIGTSSNLELGGDAVLDFNDAMTDLTYTISTIGSTLDMTSNNAVGDVVYFNQQLQNEYQPSDGDAVKDALKGKAGNDSLFTRIDTNLRNIKASINSIKTTFSNLRNPNITFSSLGSFDVTASVTTRQLRLLESLTRKREIDIMMKPRLKNYLQTYFGVNRYKDDSLYQPVFIGSTTQQILINDIAQTAATSDSPLGRQGATAMSLGSGYVGEYYCRNYGCLMGVMYILPDYDYEPGLPKEWLERTPDDFVNPEFAHLSMQPILNKELFVSSDDTWNNEVLGYMGMYDNYRTSQNLVCGELLNTSYTDIQQFAQVRRFSNDNKPEITTAFLDSNAAFDKTVFSNPSLPPFIAQCVARVEAVRPLPQLAIPRG